MVCTPPKPAWVRLVKSVNDIQEAISRSELEGLVEAKDLQYQD